MRIYTTPEQIIASALEQMRVLGQLNGERKGVLRQFLDELLSGTHTPAEIQEIRRQTPADVTLPKGERLLAFLQLIRNTLYAFAPSVGCAWTLVASASQAVGAIRSVPMRIRDNLVRLKCLASRMGNAGDCIPPGAKS